MKKPAQIPESPAITIGSTVWVFDVNHREYPESRAGRLWSGGPIYRSHWRPRKVVGETSRSWVLEYGGKAPKKGEHRGFAFSEAEIDDDCYIQERHKIVRKVEECRNAATLRAIEKLLS